MARPDPHRRSAVRSGRGLRAVFGGGALAVALVALAPSAAHANGRFPATHRLMLRPGDPTALTLLTTFGLLVSRDGADGWDWICEKAAGYGPASTDPPGFDVTGANEILIGYSGGLTVSSGGGCTWRLADGALANQFVADVAVRPDRPSSAVAVTSTGASTDDAGHTAYTSLVFATDDDGAHWAQLGRAIDPTVLVETIDVTRTAPSRLYASGKIAARPVLLVSDDAAQTWTTRDVPLDAAEDAPMIAAVDPTDADRVYIRTTNADGGATRLLVTTDAGKSFRSVFSATSALVGFALSPDGAKVYVGTPTDGLFVATRADLAFQRISPVHVQCLAAAGGVLYACADESSGFVLGVSTDDGRTFVPKLHLAGVRGPLACDPATNTGQCVPDWPALRDTLGGGADGGADAGPDGGAFDGGGGDGGLYVPLERGCNCRAVGVRTGAARTPGGGVAGGAVTIAIAAAIGAVHARRRRRSQRREARGDRDADSMTRAEEHEETRGAPNLR